MAGRNPDAVGERQADFGFATVPLKDKQRRVDDLFDQVARRYDLMNDLMSGGLHRLWKDLLVSMVKPSRNRPFAHLDVAGGTGDVAVRVAQAGSRRTRVTVLDINQKMLALGRARALEHALSDRIQFVQANAEQLPFQDHAFDAYTVAFGIRNVPDIERALAEARRVLKIGGHFLCLEFSKVDVPVLDWLYRRFAFSVIPPLGRLVIGDSAPYQYLVESIERFATPQTLATCLEGAGLRRVSFTRLAGGIVAIHSGWKL
jgi:demethylmenaquinone methyltransferase/2-methoxy-6-polyprenyl-1,4-benzoquinol methylase